MKTQKTPSNDESQSSSEATSSARKPPVRDPLKLLAQAIRTQVEPQGNGDAEEHETDDNGDEGAKPPQKPSKSKGKPKPPKNLEAVAEALGLGVDELYKLEIPAKAKGAKPYTLGALKDLAAADSDFQVAKLKLDNDRGALESQRIAAEAELQAVLAALPADAIKPESMQKLRDALGQKQQRERARTLEVMPEWQDEAVRTAELKGLLDFARTEYGLPETFLVTHMHHGLARLMRDAWRNANTIKKALEAVTEEKRTTPPKANAGGKSPPKRQTEGRQSRTQGEVGRFMNTIISAAQTRQ